MKLTKKQKEMIEWFCEEKYGGELENCYINEDSGFVVANDYYGNEMASSIKDVFYDMRYFCEDRLYDSIGDLETMDFWYIWLYKAVECIIELGI